jgi:hypothetical protein
MAPRIYLALLVLASGVATAAAPVSGPQEALLTWTAPTQYTDGNAIPAGTTITYSVYRGACGNPTKQRVWEGTALSTLLVAQPIGDQGFVVTARVGTQESAPSGEGCKVMRLAPPSDGSIESPTDGSIEYPEP